MQFSKRLLLPAAAVLLHFACATTEDVSAGGAAAKTSASGGATPKGGTNGTLGGTTAFGGTLASSGSSFGGALANAGGSFGTSGTTSGAGASSASGGMSGVPQSVLDRASAIVYYQTDFTDLSTNKIFMHLYIQNQADDALDMSHVTLRYWMTSEFGAPQLVCDYHGGNIAGPALMYTDAAADSFVEFTFTGNTIAKGSDLNLNEVQLRVEGGTFDQSNDWSFNKDDTLREPNDKITLYLAGKLIWGCEPGGACPGSGAGGAGGVTGAGGAGPVGGEPGAGGAANGGSAGSGIVEAGAGGAPSTIPPSAGAGGFDAWGASVGGALGQAGAL